MLKELKNEVQKIGKPEWGPLLIYLANLHEDSIHAPFFTLSYQWEEVAAAGDLGLIFGNWDTIHMALDTVFLEPKHALHQIMNSLDLQQMNGLVPGRISLVNNEIRWSGYTTSPPLWHYVIQEYLDLTNDREILQTCHLILKKQILWFELNRCSGEGFYYVDRVDHLLESGVEDGVRFDLSSDMEDEIVCIDTTAHVYGLYAQALKWGDLLNEDTKIWKQKIDKLGKYIQEYLFDEETGFYHDSWMIKDTSKRILAFEGIWPLVTGAATYEQAQRVINENLLEPTRFFTHHPIPSVGISDPHFEFCHWRGPTRNSMTYWAARGCLRYDRPDAALALLEKALDATSAQFHKTGTLWEFYHPQGGDPRELSRYQGNVSSAPIKDYLGHNPLIAMARIWEKIRRER